MLLGALVCACLQDKEGLVDQDGTVTETSDDDDIDRVDASCQGGRMPLPSSCGEASVAFVESQGAEHLPQPEPISYSDNPPSSGDHRPSWARWGEYDYLPPQRWLHNLEHGGVAFLYDPCVSVAVVEALRSFARSQPEDETGAFRWVLTPYPGLSSGVAVVAWEWTWQADCLDVGLKGSLQSFIDEHYRAAPEDLAGDGGYATGWIGR